MTIRPRLAVPQIALAIAVLIGGCSPGAGASPVPGSGSTEQPSSPTARSGPSRASLIQQAIDEGRIDQVTGLIYRAQSALGIPGLPAEFERGAPLRDDSVLTSMAVLMPELSPEDQARLRPFLVRPTDPESIFHAPRQAVTGAVAQDDVPAKCLTWADSGDLDSRFKVWACADNDPAAAEIDIATVVVMVAEIWGPMTAEVPAGMGPPKADTVGPDPRGQHGGDGRIDFYLLDLGQIIYRDDENNTIYEDAAAMAVGTDPFTNSTASGFILLNRYRLADTRDMKLDVIHELFHVLQYAHNVDAPMGAPGHWFVEASATWSEVYYDQPHSEKPHAWHGYFQNSMAGLEATDPDHQYSAYIWPFFMQQEKQAASVFNAWAAIGQIGDGTQDQVSEAVSDQLSFEENFHEFAVRNVNIENTLTQAGVKTYEQSDGHFWENAPPGHMASASIVPGQPYISPPGGAAPLAANYYSFELAENARDVTVSIVNVTPSEQVDGDALVNVVGSGWERRPLPGGMLKFCRDNPPDDIDAVVLVVSNHGRERPLLGSVEASAKDSCGDPDAIVLQGTIRGTGTERGFHSSGIPDRTIGQLEVTMEVTITIKPDDWTSSGTATVTGEYTGDCEYSDSDSGPMTEMGMHIFDPADPTDMIAWVTVDSYDPRFQQRPLTGLYIGAFGRTARTGGTCGHVLGPVDDAVPALSVTLGSCNFFEILNNSGTWHGECTQQSDQLNSLGQPYNETHWTANLEQISPRETPAGR